jgi:peptidoglycan/LPS O-acetylase OafA/YrhL
MNFHYFLGSSDSQHWYRYGNLGVQLFFIISGFVIVLSLKDKTIKDFAKSRFIRLVPLFWILCSLTYVITLVVPNARPLTFHDFLTSMSMFGDQINGFIHYGGLIDASYWTLSVELIFYFAIGIFVYLFSFKKIRYFLLSWLIVSTVSNFLHIDNNYYIKWLLVHHASYFVFGSSLALIITKEAKNFYEKFIDYLLLCGSAIYSTYIISSIYPPYLAPNHLDAKLVTFINVLLFGCVIYVVYLSPKIKNLTTLKILAIVGGLTYPLYLLHQTIGTTVINYLSDTSYLSRNTFTVLFEVLIIGIACTAYIYDKKMRNLLKLKFT